MQRSREFEELVGFAAVQVVNYDSFLGGLTRMIWVCFCDTSVEEII